MLSSSVLRLVPTCNHISADSICPHVWPISDKTDTPEIWNMITNLPDALDILPRQQNIVLQARMSHPTFLLSFHTLIYSIFLSGIHCCEKICLWYHHEHCTTTNIAPRRWISVLRAKVSYLRLILSFYTLMPSILLLSSYGHFFTIFSSLSNLLVFLGTRTITWQLGIIWWRIQMVNGFQTVEVSCMSRTQSLLLNIARQSKRKIAKHMKYWEISGRKESAPQQQFLNSNGGCHGFAQALLLTLINWIHRPIRNDLEANGVYPGTIFNIIPSISTTENAKQVSIQPLCRTGLRVLGGHIYKSCVQMSPSVLLNLPE